MLWMVWGTWITVGPKRHFFRDNSRPISSNSDPRYLAFIGFWVALIAVIFLPIWGILSLILTGSWGAYSAEDGEWKSYAERVAVLIATFGSLGVMWRMSKVGRSPLEIEFWTNRFRPKEVSACIKAVEDLRPLFTDTFAKQNLLISADSVLSQLESRIISPDARKLLLSSIEAGNSPRDVILYAIAQMAKSLLGSGQFHVYRGILNMEGTAIRAAFYIAIDELLKSGILNREQAAAERAEVEAAIKQAG